MMNGEAAHRAVSRESDESRCIRVAMTMGGEQIRSRRRARRTGRPFPRLRDGSGPGALQTNPMRNQQTAFEQITARRHPDPTATCRMGGIQRFLKSRRVIARAIALRAEAADVEMIGPMDSASAACAEEATDAASKASPAVVKASRRVVGAVGGFMGKRE
jgi:hypothetical protein